MPVACFQSNCFAQVSVSPRFTSFHPCLGSSTYTPCKAMGMSYQGEEDLIHNLERIPRLHLQRGSYQCKQPRVFRHSFGDDSPPQWSPHSPHLSLPAPGEMHWSALKCMLKQMGLERDIRLCCPNSQDGSALEREANSLEVRLRRSRK